MSVSPDTPFPRPGSALALALKSAGAQQARLTAWAHWWHEVSRIPYEVSDPAVGEKKLLWWQQAVADAHRQPPQHPLLKALAGEGGLANQDILPPQTCWQGQLQALGDLLHQTRWLDSAGLQSHMQQSTGLALEGAAWLLGVRNPEALTAARDLGVALRKAHILTRVGQDTHAGWLHLPVDLLQQHGTKAHEWTRPAADAPSVAMKQLMQQWQQATVVALNDSIDRLNQAAGPVSPALRPLRVLAALNVKLMEDLDAHDYQILRQRISVGPWRKWFTAWRTR
jgi:phytoene synthase